MVSGGPRGEVLVPAVRSVVTELRPEAGYLVSTAWPWLSTHAASDRSGDRDGVEAEPGGLMCSASTSSPSSPMSFPAPSARPSRDAPWNAGWPSCRSHDLRTWGLGRHRSVDDYPYGGGAGMVLRPEPIAAALEAVAPRTLLRIPDPPRPGRRAASPRRARPTSPAGSTSSSSVPATRASTTACATSSTSSSRWATTSCPGARSLPWSSSTPCCACCPAPSTPPRRSEESFAHGLLEYPQYTRPPVFEGRGRARDPGQRRTTPRCRLAPRAGARADRRRDRPRPAVRPTSRRPRGLSREPALLYSALDPVRQRPAHVCPPRPAARRSTRK